MAVLPAKLWCSHAIRSEPSHYYVTARAGSSVVKQPASLFSAKNAESHGLFGRFAVSKYSLPSGGKRNSPNTRCTIGLKNSTDSVSYSGSKQF